MEQRRRSMIDTARKICSELDKEECIRGVFLFGSTVTGGIHPESDIDLGLVWGGPEKEKPGRHTEEQYGQKVEFLYLSPNQIEGMFSVGHGGCIDWFRTCKTLYDPDGLIRRWKERADAFRWTEDQMTQQIGEYTYYREQSQNMLEENDVLSALVALREAGTHLARAFLMTRNNPRHLDPKDILHGIKGWEELENVFLGIQFGGRREPSTDEIRQAMKELEKHGANVKRSVTDTRYRRSFRDYDLHMNSVREGLWRGNPRSGLIHLRRAAHLLVGTITGRHMGREDYLVRIGALRDLRPDMYELYPRIQQIGDTSEEEIRTYTKRLHSLAKEKRLVNPSPEP